MKVKVKVKVMMFSCLANQLNRILKNILLLILYNECRVFKKTL